MVIFHILFIFMYFRIDTHNPNDHFIMSDIPPEMLMGRRKTIVSDGSNPGDSITEINVGIF